MAFPMNTKTLLSALACACVISSNATPILDVESWQNNWDFEILITASNLPERGDLYIDGVNVGWLKSDTAFHRSGMLPQDLPGLYSVGEHTAYLEFPDGSRLFGDETYTISAPDGLRPFATDIPDGGSSALLLCAGLVGLLSLKRNPSVR